MVIFGVFDLVMNFFLNGVLYKFYNNIVNDDQCFSFYQGKNNTR